MDFSPVNKMCSFCGKQGTPETTFAGGLGAMICVDCLEHYHELMQSEERIDEAAKPPWDHMSDAEMLDSLPLILKSADQVNAFAADWIELIRERRISWAEIGKVLGVSRQAAWERFSQKSGGGKSAAG